MLPAETEEAGCIYRKHLNWFLLVGVKEVRVLICFIQENAYIAKHGSLVQSTVIELPIFAHYMDLSRQYKIYLIRHLISLNNDWSIFFCWPIEAAVDSIILKIVLTQEIGAFTK